MHINEHGYTTFFAVTLFWKSNCIAVCSTYIQILPGSSSGAAPLGDKFGIYTNVWVQVGHEQARRYWAMNPTYRGLGDSRWGRGRGPPLLAGNAGGADGAAERALRAPHPRRALPPAARRADT